MNKNQKIGKFGEDLTLDLFLKKNYIFIERNVKTSYQELDLILRKKALTIFVEVKTRANLRFGSATEAMTSRKLFNFKQAVMKYSCKKRINLNYVRLDFVAIDVDKYVNKVKISHIVDVA